MNHGDRVSAKLARPVVVRSDSAGRQQGGPDPSDLRR
jgi:hypothetical protein